MSFFCVLIYKNESDPYQKEKNPYYTDRFTLIKFSSVIKTALFLFSMFHIAILSPLTFVLRVIGHSIDLRSL
jgi:hypothetical protein